MELFKLLGKISIDTDEANKAIKDTTDQAEDSAKKQEGAFSKIGKSAAKVGKAVAGAGTVMSGAFIAAVEGTREYRVSMGKLETAFTTSGHSADTARSTYQTLNSVLGDSDVAVEAANHLAKLTDNQKDLNTWTDICTGVFATFGDSLPIEGLTEAANETAKTGVLTGGLTDALNWAGVAEDEFQQKLDACSTEQERQKLITETMNGLYSESAETYKKNNKELIEAEAANGRLKDAMAALGEAGEPIMTAIKNAISGMADAAIPKVQALADKIKEGIDWVKTHQDTIHAWVAVIVGAGVAIGTFLLILNWGAIMAAASTALGKVKTAFLAVNAAMKANPIGLVIALITGLVAAFIYLWNNNEGFRKFWLNMWEKIKSTASSVISAVKGKFNDLQAGLNTVKNIFSSIQKTIADKMEAARSKVKAAIDKIRGFFNFKWSLPNLKMPSIKISGKFSINPPSVPKFSIKWNAEGGVLTKPTIFGMSGNTFLGGGEAGHEAILPVDTLKTYINESVDSRNNELLAGLEIQVSRLISFMQAYFPANYEIMLDTGILAGQLAPEMDSRLAEIYRHNKRGNTR